MAAWWQNATSSLASVATTLATATATVSESISSAAAAVIETVEARKADFERENAAFSASLTEADRAILPHERESEAVPPWVGMEDEANLREQILALSADKRNFLLDPPETSDFKFSLIAYAPIAQATAQYDLRLDKLRFSLVPKAIDEERFWRNYFYRVSLIKQASQLAAVAADTKSESVSASPKLSQSQLESTPEAMAPKEDASEGPSPTSAAISAITFVEDPSQSDEWLTSLKEDFESLGVASTSTNVIASTGADLEWEMELERELLELEK